MTDEALCDTLRREQTGVILQGTCTGKCGRERRQAFGEAVEILTGVRVHVGANDANAEAHTSLAAGKRPGIAGGRGLAAHDETERGWIMIGGREIILGTVAVALESAAQSGARNERARKTAGIDDHGRTPLAYSVAVIFRDDANDASTLDDWRLHRRVWVDLDA